MERGRGTQRFEAERQRCAASFRYFLRYWRFVNRESGKVLQFDELWPGQDELVGLMETKPWLFALKAGKLGFTEIACAYDGWVALFAQPNARVHLFSRDLEAAKELRRYILFGLSHLPPWLSLPIAEGPGSDTTTAIRMRAGEDDVRTIVCYAAGTSVSIDQSCSHAHVDELAHMLFGEALWNTVETTVAPGGSCHVITRGAGPANFSAALWQRAISGDAEGLHAFFSPWHMRPDRDEDWYSRHHGQLDEAGLMQFAPKTWEEAIGGPAQNSVVPLAWLEEALRR